MMNRFEIKAIRDAAEANGFFVELIKPDCIMVSHLKNDDDKYIIYADEKCPECGEYLIYQEGTKEFVCLGEDCFYNNCLETPPEPIYETSEQPKKVMEMKFTFDELDQVYANAFIEDIEQLIENWYEDLIEIEFFEDLAANESTLGYITDLDDDDLEYL